MRDVLAPLVVALAIIVFALALQPALPRCPEDAVIVGTGQFQDGRWAAYQCGPAFDDMAARDD